MLSVAPSLAQDTATRPAPGAYPEGAEGYALTALRGTEIERIPLRYVGILEDFLGPDSHLHLVRLEGDVADHVGVAAGMSGSPVYIDGELIGALAYRFGTLPRDAIAGVTPIESVRRAARSAASLPPESEVAKPIRTPLASSRLHPELRAWARDQLESIGMVWTDGAVVGSGDSEVARELAPGSPVGVTLVRGDWSFAATGTVTTVEDGIVYAFGHPFLGVGEVELPMHAASVVHTLADEVGSTKMSHIGDELGTITDDRLTAIVGRMGRRTELIPMVIRVRMDEEQSEHNVEIVNAPGLTPVLAAVSVSNAVLRRVEREQGVTAFVTGSVRVPGKPDLPFELSTAGEGPGTLAGAAAVVQSALAMLWNNPFEKPQVSGIEVDVTVERGIRRYFLESLQYDRKTVRPGENMKLSAILRPYRGDPVRQDFELRLPHGIADGARLRVAIGPQDQVERALGNPLQRRFLSAADLSGVLHVIGELRSGHRLFAVLYSDSPSVVRDGVELSHLPSTAVHLLSTGARSGAASKARVSRLSTTQIELDGPVAGGLTIGVRVGDVDPSESNTEESP